MKQTPLGAKIAAFFLLVLIIENLYKQCRVCYQQRTHTTRRILLDIEFFVRCNCLRLSQATIINEQKKRIENLYNSMSCVSLIECV